MSDLTVALSKPVVFEIRCLAHNSLRGMTMLYREHLQAPEADRIYCVYRPWSMSSIVTEEPPMRTDQLSC